MTQSASRRRTLQIALLVGVGLGNFGCQSLLPSPLWPSPSTTQRLAALPSEIATAKNVIAEWSAQPETIERLFGMPIELRSSQPVEHGQTVTRRLTIYSPQDDLEFDVKWKAAKPSFDGLNNAPRREIAAYQVQQLVLDPSDYVVPTTSLLCLPPNALPGRVVGEPNLPGADCVVGAVSLWLREVRYPERKIDWMRFRDDPNYAHHASNLNIVGILMDHSDTHTRNLLVSKDPSNRRMFSIDNGIAFNSWFRSPFSRDWNRVRVPGLRRSSIERLQTLRRVDLDYLAVLAELRSDGTGVFKAVPVGLPLKDQENKGVRRSQGVLQLGLTTSEIDAIWNRIARLLALVDSGQIPQF